MFLDDIVADRRREVATARVSRPLRELETLAFRQAKPLDFAGALQDNGVRLIAEAKKASPSKGLLVPNFDPVGLARVYAENGAAAISVLTEERYFQGSLGYLSAIRQAVALPLLRKDFIFDPYQVWETRACGADALLLIAAILNDEKLRGLLDLSRDLGMECLVEVHDETELERALGLGAQVIGINNRDLRTFKVDLATTHRLASRIPPGRVIVSESGIKSREDIDLMRGWGVHAILVGEALVTAQDVAAKVRELA
ncbi:MAG: indole-3-glycerol phosphate synthase TrpC [Chloroflexi bacterium]|nr:indole-3-glycerol phosphate synthase TrpC [Chloroflexota bacterium]